MAAGLLAIFDDVAMLLDDAAMMSKLAAKKTAGLLGDDLAVNAEKATGFHASRELPVIWAIMRGSVINKIIILPLAFLLSAYLSWLIVPVLLLGGAYLCYEGAEKVYEWLSRHEKQQPAAFQVDDPGQIMQSEQTKIKSAIRTDFILSIEIIVISLETVVGQSMGMQIAVVSFIALLATVAVYGLVALLVRMDDTGLYLIEHAQQMSGRVASMYRAAGQSLVSALPRVIRLLGIVGTIAMLLVGGGMYVHHVEWVHHLMEVVPSLLADLLAGMIVGALLLASIALLNRIRQKAGNNAG